MTSASALLPGWTRVGTALALGSLALTVDNLRRVRVPSPDASAPAGPDGERVALLLPVRDEAAHVERVVPQLVAAARASRRTTRVVVLDDGSTDGTTELLAALAARDDLAFETVTGTAPPAGWLGKPWACAQLAEQVPEVDVLVFVDADVELTPAALEATVDLMRAADLDLVSPYPRQIAGTVGERLVQPLLAWSWTATLPLGLAERSSRASLSAANGQLLAVDSGVYRLVGGHGAVRSEVVEDVALVRAVKKVGGRGGVVDGHAIASCRMYDGWPDLRAGYTKSLWAAFGSGPGAGVAMGLLVTAYVVPPVAALAGSRTGLVGYLAGVASRALVARRTGGRVLPDVWAHPVSVAVLAGLTVDSFVGRRRGVLRWRGRAVEVLP